ncbi:DoxX family membrane protein [Cellulomonas sp. HZM]|uniref:DoxX family membrane protein n=1 Tax=Cellulomonas sp. HZM TaxID=1454010 RepID=UPI0006895DFF|nr:DoxX family membrane protein [Cellulomonas sp. HZM]
MSTVRRATRAGVGLLTLVRVALGALWLHEGVVKVRAGFGAADIGFVADNARTDGRVPGYFSAFADHVLGPAAGLFGVLMPALEIGLGLALVAGVLTLTAAVGSVVTLMSYWSADQLIDQYPVMVLLAIPLLLWPAAAARLSVTAAVLRRPGRAGTRIDGTRWEGARRWL